MTLSEFRDQFEPRFRTILQTHVACCTGLTRDPFLQQLIAYSEQIAAHGKRLRPYMTFLGSRAGNGVRDDAFFELAAGIELFHVFCLIHDDVIDRAATRHGVKTLEAHAYDALRVHHRVGNLEHVARSQAILVGDYFFGWAAKSVLSAASRTQTIEVVSKHFFCAVNEVITGQMIDVDTTTRQEQQEDMLFEKFRLKTATYSFVRPFMLGLALADVKDPSLFIAAESIGRPLGIAFQIQDDVLDVMGDEEKLGKPILSDLADGQQTLLTTHFFHHADGKLREEFALLMRRVLTADERQRAKEILTSSGAVAYAEQRADEFLREAQSAIDRAIFSSEVKRALSDLTMIIKNRTS